jgi:cytochrome c556
MRSAARFAVIAVGLLVGAEWGAPSLRPAFGQSPRPETSIKQLMEAAITDASNTIWATSEAPTTAAEWRALETAAQRLIDAAEVVATGGTGPRDDEWAKQPAWKTFTGVMLSASEQALAAARTKNYDALLAASDVLYPPCEGCHLQFNPDITGEQK